MLKNYKLFTALIDRNSVIAQAFISCYTEPMTKNEYEAAFRRQFHWTSSFLSGLALMVIDALTLMLCIGISFFIVNLIDHAAINFRSFVGYAIYLPLIFLVFNAAGLYPGIMASPAEDVKKFCICTFFSFMGIAMSIFVEDNEEKIGIAFALTLAVPIATILLPGLREGAKHVFGRFRWWGVPAVIYSEEGSSGDFVTQRLISRGDLGYKPCAIVDGLANKMGEKTFVVGGQNVSIPVFPPTDDVTAMIRRLNIKVGIVCGYDSSMDKMLKAHRYTITATRSRNPLVSGSLQLKDIGGIVGFSSVHNLTKRSSLLVKRAIDIAIVLLTLPLVVPMSAIIALIIKITSPGPILYGHSRIGQYRRPFKCWKFRSMRQDADKVLDEILANSAEMREQWEKERKLLHDPRVTPFGAFIRKTSLDELPQLWNIFIGEMSFVGPRPVTESELDRYEGEADYILSVTPGLSGMWQTSGRSDTEYEERITLDTYYIQNWSVWLDIWILIKTVWVVLGSHGAY